MDENQLKYQRLLNLTDEQMQYKMYQLVLDFGYYYKKVVIRACCMDEVWDSTNEHKRIKSNKQIT